MSKQPFLPMFVGDFFAATIEWEGEERALYALMLMHQWAVGSLPADTSKLIKTVAYTQKNFDFAWPTVSTKFVEKGGRLFNGRLEQHRIKANEIADKRAKAGAKGGETTKAKLKQVLEQSLKQMLEQMPGENEANAKANGQANGQANAEILLSHPSHPIPSYPNPSHPNPGPVVTLSQDSDVLRTQERAASTSGSMEKQKINGHEQEPQGFSEIRAAYPARTGQQRWPDAIRHYRANLRKKFTAQQMLEGVERYASYCDAEKITGLASVQQAATFLGRNQGFLEQWTPSPSKSQQRQNKNIAASEQWLRDQETKDAAE